MSTGYEAAGRTNQKLRTRNALVEAARELVKRGITPTVEQAAEAASISRTTAYRYFATRQELLAAAHPHTALATLLPRNASSDPRERLATTVAGILRITLKTERQGRTMLRLSLEDGPRRDLPLRQGRAIGWIEEALEPLRGKMPEEQLRRLVLAIRSAAGIEALVWLVDVAGLSRKQAAEVMQWSARALLEQALVESSLG